MPTSESEDRLKYLQLRMDLHHSYFRRHEPKRSKNVMAKVLMEKGYGNIQSRARLNKVWKKVAGELLANNSRVGSLRKGVLEVIVSNSILVQEMTFIKATLLKNITKELSNLKIIDIRCKVGQIETN